MPRNLTLNDFRRFKADEYMNARCVLFLTSKHRLNKCASENEARSVWNLTEVAHLPVLIRELCTHCRVGLRCAKFLDKMCDSSKI